MRLQMLSTSHSKAMQHYTGTAQWGQQLGFMALLMSVTPENHTYLVGLFI